MSEMPKAKPVELVDFTVAQLTAKTPIAAQALFAVNAQAQSKLVQNRFRAAETTLERLDAALSKVGTKEEQADTAYFLAHSQSRLNETTAAKANYERAISLYRETNNTDS